MSIEKLETELKAAVTLFGEKTKSIDTFLAEQAAKSKDGETLTKEASEEAKKAVAELVKHGDRLKDIEQKIAESVKKGTDMPESLGEQFVKSDSMLKFKDGLVHRVKLNADTYTLGFKSTVVQSDATTAPDRQPGVIPGAFRQLRVRDLLPQGNTGVNVIEATREATFTDNAAETAEGAQKPETDITFELVTTPIRTIAHFLKISKQLAEDAPTVASYIDTRLIYGVEKRIDSQIVVGDGSGANISGMTHAGNFTAFNALTGDTGIDSMAKSLAQLAASDYGATGFVMNPQDWWKIQLIKDSQGRYVYGDPSRGPGTSLWGLPVAATNAMPVGHFMAADFPEAYFWWQRKGTIVEMFEQDEDNVQLNLLTLRAEARGALETRVPAAALYGILTA